MTQISYRNLHFPPSIVQQTVRLYASFSPNLCEVEELLASGAESRVQVAQMPSHRARLLSQMDGWPTPQPSTIMSTHEDTLCLLLNTGPGRSLLGVRWLPHKLYTEWAAGSSF